MKRHVKKPTLVGLFSLLITVKVSFVIFGFAAFAQAAEPTVFVKVSIERVTTHQLLDCDLSPGAPCDFYPKVWIDGEFFTRGDISDENDIYPDWVFITTTPIPISKISVPVTIQIWDSDPSGNPDDHVGLTPYPRSDRDIHLTVNLVPCSVTGDFIVSPTVYGGTAACRTQLVSSGRTGGWDEWASIYFRVDVIEPPYGPNLRVRCLHSPIWPKPTETVTITAEALDGLLNPRIADQIEIWVNDTTQPAATTSGTKGSITVGPFSDPAFQYNCKVKDTGVPIPVSTAWHIVSVGEALADLYGGVAAVYYNGSRASSVDIVFHPDQNSYPGGSTSQPFLDAVRQMIFRLFQGDKPASAGADYIRDFVLLNQYRVNFWISKSFAHVAVPAPTGKCGGPFQPPCPCQTSLDKPFEYWSDSKFFLHTQACRDHAWRGGKQFTSGAGNAITATHEMGHAVFGLADEYCCDSHYFQPNPLANLYSTEENCKNDAPNVGRTGSECRQLRDVNNPLKTVNWWTSDPEFPDLMGPFGSNGRPNLLDQRRIDWKFSSCDAGNC